MASTSIKAATSGAQTLGPGSVTWSNPGNITSADASDATATGATPAYTEYLRASAFGFTSSDVPAGATIDGIEFTVRARASATSRVVFNNCYISTTANSPTGSTFNDGGASLTTSNAFYSLGGPTFLPAALTQAIVTGANFGLMLEMAFTGVSATAYIDYVAARVYYTPAATPLAIDDAASSSIADPVFLTAKSALAVASSVGSTAIDAVTLLPKSALAANDAAVEVSIDAGLITPIIALLIADAVSVTTIEAVSLASLLMAEDAVVVTAADQVTLIAQSALTAADLVSVSTIDAVTIVPGALLSVSEMTFATHLGELTVSVIFVTPPERTIIVDANRIDDRIISVEENRLADRFILAA